jgi:fatty acid desaturase
MVPPKPPIQYNETPIPEEMVKRINETVARHTRADLTQSMFHLAQDTALLYTTYHIFQWISRMGLVPWWILYPLYSVVMGTIATGIMVLGHECGHGSFGETRLQNDIVGFVLHSFLLIPYFSWQYSHNKHHKYTNHLITGETHVPDTKRGAALFFRVREKVGDDMFPIISIMGHVLIGWPYYLLMGATSGRTTADLDVPLNRTKPMDHFRPSSQLMPDRLSNKVLASTGGCIAMIGLLAMNGMIGKYIGPYLVTNMWMVLYTWLHHTDPAVPHYGVGTDELYSHTVGALCTIDRPYPWIFDQLHHHMGSTHVAHHLNYRIPHYRAVQCTEELKLVLGDRYLYDPTPIWRAALRVARECIYVDGVDGVQYYESDRGSIVNKKLD